MNKFVYKMYKFMYGRYGIDELYKINIGLCILLSIVNIFFNNRVISAIEWILLFITIYRSMSRNLVRRRYERDRYLKIKKGFCNRISLVRRKWRDRNTHLYKRCPKCGTVLRLPLKKGVHMCKCPTCSNRFEVKCRRNEKVKVEVIREK